MKVVVIIPAAGLGTRMAPASDAKGKKLAASKQFSELGGTPILLHTLRKFAASPEISEIYVALRAGEIAGFRSRLENEPKDFSRRKIELVEGGEHRQQSVANAMSKVSAAPDDIVLVHDAVRPFVTSEIIHNVIEAARKHGGNAGHGHGQASRAHRRRSCHHSNHAPRARGDGANAPGVSV